MIAADSSAYPSALFGHVWRVPLLFLALLLCAYWARVVRMAYKFRRRKRKPVNVLPAERMGQILRLIWTPVIVVWVAQPFVVALRRHQPFLLRPIFYRPWVAWPALGIAVICFVLTRICWRAMGRNWRMGIDPAERNPILSSGPYRIVRHPIYALSIVLMLATLAMIPTPLMFCAVVIHVAFLIWEARREERHMMNVHGPRYADYCTRVGAFVPRMSA